MSETINERIRAYWEMPSTVSIIDKNLHRLEVETVCRYLLPSDRLADLGCGDGTATAEYARHVSQVIGIERSSEMRRKAASSLADIANAQIRDGDVLHPESLGSDWDVVVSQRLLINLASFDEQKAAIRNIHACLRPGGRYVMIENTNEGFAAMNAARHRMGIPPVPQHWHNRFFSCAELEEALAGRFQTLKHLDFALYYLLTRVYANMVAKFEGWGIQAQKDPIFEQLDDAARQLHEQFADWLKPPEPFGPIQVWVLRKES